MSREENQAVARRWHEAWGAPAISSAYAECLAPDFKAHFFGQGTIDRETYIQRDTEFAKAFNDIRITAKEMVAEGDIVMSHMTWSATHTGAFRGIAPTGKWFTIDGFGLDRFRNGKVVEHYPLFDQLSMLQQLDVATGPAQQEAAAHRM